MLNFANLELLFYIEFSAFWKKEKKKAGEGKESGVVTLAFLLWKVQSLPVLLKQWSALRSGQEWAPLTDLAALSYSSCKLQAFLFHSPRDKSSSALSKHVYCLIFINLGKSTSRIMPGKNFALQKGLEQVLHFSSVQPVKFFLLQRHNFIIHAVFRNSWHRFSQA